MENSFKKISSIAACMIVQLCIGIVYMWSALKSDVAASYGWDADTAGMVYSYMLMAYVVGNLLGGLLNDAKGPKTACLAGVAMFAAGLALSAAAVPFPLFVLTYGVLGGAGSGLAYGACISCIQKWMPDKTGLATGLACCSFGLSTVIFTPLFNSMMEANRGADGMVDFVPVFLIAAAVIAAAGLIACVFISLPEGARAALGKNKGPLKGALRGASEDEGTAGALRGADKAEEAGRAAKAAESSPGEVTGSAAKAEEGETCGEIEACAKAEEREAGNENKTAGRGGNLTLPEALKTPVFWALFLVILLINGTWNLCVPLIKDLGIVRGLSPSAAVLCVSLTGVFNAGGRLIMAAISDKLGRSGMMYLLCAMTFAGALLMTFIGGFGYFFVILMLAFAFGGPSSINAAMSTDLFGPAHSGANYGAAMLAVGISSIIFNFISEHFLNASVDASGGAAQGIVPTFVMAAATAAAAFFLMVYISRYLKKRDRT